MICRIILPIRRINIRKNTKVERVGESKLNKGGHRITIIEYINNANIVAEMEDGTIYRGSYSSFINGSMGHKRNYKEWVDAYATKYIGLEKYNNFGEHLKIIGYREYKDIDVIFDDGTILEHAKFYAFKNGGIKNPNTPSVLNVGYYGNGIYNSDDRAYNYWRSLMERCYSEKFQTKRPRYKYCTVCDEWLNYQNFAKWFNNNYYEIEGEAIQLDKDILVKNNTLYHPDYCVFVPMRINTLFIKSNSTRGSLPIGVHIRYGRYEATCSYGKSRCRSLGRFDSAQEAFDAYKSGKEKYIRSIANEYRNKIPEKLYEAMINYKVDITD